MTQPLRGRPAVVTGGGGGIGQAVAGALARAGVSLLLVDIDGAALTAARERLAAAGQTGVRTLVADIATHEGRRAIEDAAAAMDGGPDILVNNAGVERVSRYVALTDEEIRHAVDVNLLGAMLLTHRLLDGMLSRRRGHVITVASMAAIKPVPFNAVYNTSKAGLVAFSTSLSKELERSGVHATVLCPSGVRGVGMWARRSDQLPSNRLVEASTIAASEVADAAIRALERPRRRVLVASPMVRSGALLSALSPGVDLITDHISRIGDIYRRRIDTDRGNPL